MLTQRQNPPLKKLLKIYKPISFTSLDLIKLWRNNYSAYQNIKLAYAGRLDPMAHGLMIILVGNECKQQQTTYHGLDKKYFFKVLWGWQSDTYDVMGILKNHRLEIIPKKLEQHIKKIIPNFLGKQEQPFPQYSAKPINGQPLMYWARKGKINQIKIPTKQVNIYNLQYLGTHKVTQQIIIQNIIHRINNVQGRFRQKIILAQWNQIFNINSANYLYISSFKAHVSTGTYIRTLIHEMGKQLNTGAIAWDIFRTQLGDFSLTDNDIFWL